MITREIPTPHTHRIVKHGNTAYIGGLVAEDESADMRGQTQQVLARLDRLLAQAGSDRTRVLHATVFITDQSQRAAMNEVWKDFFGEHKPARATIGAAFLGRPTTLIEVVCTAAI